MGERDAVRHRRGGVDQVGDGLGLRQIDLAVEEGALCELAGVGQTGAVVEQALQDERRRKVAAVAIAAMVSVAGCASMGPESWVMRH
jgi:hypothetical protein